MPRLTDSASRTDTMVWGVNHLLGLHGPTGMTMRALSRATGISTSSLAHHYVNREHIMRVAAGRTSRARERHIWAQLPQRGAVALLPRDTADERLDARIWLAWQEVHRSDPGTWWVLAEARERERGLVSAALQRRLDDPAVQEVHALAEGLSAAVCAPERPLDLAAAHRLLADRAADLTVQLVSPVG